MNKLQTKTTQKHIKLDKRRWEERRRSIYGLSWDAYQDARDLLSSPI